MTDEPQCVREARALVALVDASDLETVMAAMGFVPLMERLRTLSAQMDKLWESRERHA